MRATASGGVPAKHRRFLHRESSRVPHCFLESPFERQFQGSCLTRSCLIGSVNGSNGLMSGNSRNFQGLHVPTSVSDGTNEDSKRVFLIVSDWSSRHVSCSKLRKPPPPKRDPDRWVAGCLSPYSLTSKNTYGPFAPESSFALRHCNQWSPQSWCSHRWVDVTTGTRAHVPSTMFHEASTPQQCGSDCFVHLDWSEKCLRSGALPSARSAALHRVLNCLVRPRASDCLKNTGNDGQHEVHCSWQLPTANTPVFTTQP